jgi:hypothetical protein
VGDAAFLAEIAGAQVGALIEAVGDRGARNARQQRGGARIVAADDRQPVERQVMQEVDEGLVQLLDSAAVGGHVVGLDIGHHGEHRLQVHERGIALVRLRDQEAARAEARVGIRAVEPPADDEGRIQPRLGQHAGDQAGGGGLAVGAGDGDAIAKAHELGEHLGALDHRNAPPLRFEHLRVVARHGAGHDDHVRALEVRRAVAKQHFRAE